MITMTDDELLDRIGWLHKQIRRLSSYAYAITSIQAKKLAKYKAENLVLVTELKVRP